jgi:hypothetical protein
MIPVRLPDGRIAQVNTNDPAVARAAVRKQLAAEALLGNKTGKPDRPTAMDTTLTAMANGPTLGLYNVAEAAIPAAALGLKRMVTGEKSNYGGYDAYRAIRDIQKQNAEAAPWLSGGVGLLAGLRMPGMGKVADFVAGKAGAELAPGLLKDVLASKNLPAVTLRSAAAGAPIGAVGGAAAAKPGEEVQGAKTGLLTGIATSAAVPSVAGGVARGATAVAKTGGRVVGDLARGGLNLAGFERKDTGGVAVKQLLDALRVSKATPDQMRTILAQWRATGASDPSILDLASKLPGGGGPVRRLIMGASMHDQGVGPAGQYAEQVATNLPENADRLVRGLTPDEPRTAAQVAKELKDTKSGIADTTYKTPYAQPVEVTPEITNALADSHGVAAIKQAINEATSNRDYGRADRLGAFLKSSAGDSELPTFTHPDGTPMQLSQFVLDGLKARMPKAAEDVGLQAGDLDRVQIAFGKRGATQQANEAGVAKGLFQRQRDINDALDQVPGLKEARATYRGYTGQEQALDLGRQGIGSGPNSPSLPSDEYVAQLGEKTGMATPEDNPYPVSAEDIKGAAGVGYRQAATDAIENPPAGSTGIVNKLATSPRQAAIQDATFGPEVGGRTREGLNNELLKLSNARRNNPGFGSGSVDRAMAVADLPSVPKSASGAIMMALARLHQGAALTGDERAAIVNAGLASASPEGLIDQMHPDIHPILDTIDEWAQAFAPASGGGAAQVAAQPR